ncbi:hypothetical protein KAR91_41170 [Candidatus Pacearchaeota archaeon]|nr:hypothetical protein [Candidatus Pacearchaeota archaeon]
MIDVKDIVPEEPEAQLYCTTCEQYVILSRQHGRRSCMCERVAKSGVSLKENWVYVDDFFNPILEE